MAQQNPLSDDWKINLVFIGILGTSLAIGANYLWHRQNQLESRWLTKIAENSAHQFLEISRNAQYVMEADARDAIQPLQAQLIGFGLGVQPKYYSPYGFSWRNQVETPFNIQVWQTLSRERNHFSQEWVETAHGPVYRIGQGIFLSEDCQKCNFMKWTGEPETLQPGQLIGVAEWELPLNQVALQYQSERLFWQQQRYEMMGLLLLLSGISIAAFMFFVRTVRKNIQSKLTAIQEILRSERHQLEKERLQSEENIQFTRVVSRELRTPVNSILGLSELLLADNPSAAQSEKIRLLGESAREIVNVLDNVIELKKLESDQASLYPTKTSLKKILHHVIHQFEAKSRQQQLDFVVHLDPRLPDSLQLDAKMVQQILTHLIHHALEETKKGGIGIEVTAIDPAPNCLSIMFKVMDTSPGIPENKLPHLFTQMSTGPILTFTDEEQLRSHLILAKKLVTKMDGNIGVKSTLGKGTTFWFSLTIQRDAATHADHHAPQPLEGKRILLIHEVEVLGELLKTALEQSGAVVHLVDSIQAADIYGSHPAYQSCIVEEYAIQDKTMFAALQQTLACPVLLLTLSGDGPNTIQSPVETETLITRISSGAMLPSNTIISHLTKSGTPLRILMVEDNQVNRMVATNMLTKMGHQVEVASNGLEALQKISEQEFDLVLMDIQMPEMNGVDATQEIRRLSDPKKSRVPVIALTADAMIGDKEKYLRAGLDGYLSKPFDSESLQQVIEETLRK